MSFFRSYIKPTKGGAKAPTAPAPAQMEMSASSRPSTVQTPATKSGYTTPYRSRPGSIHPSGDFRNSGMEEVNEIKCSVAMNWVFQLQNEYMWNGGSLGEGVVMRKAPRQFIACPPELITVRGGLFEAAAELNSKVRHVYHSSRFWALTEVVGSHDSQHKSHQPDPTTRRSRPHTAQRWTQGADSS